MEEIENFYLKIISELKFLQTNRLSNEQLHPLKFPVYQKRRETWKARNLAKKEEKIRSKIEKGYYKGINDCIKKIEKIYKVKVKCFSKES